MRLSARTFVVGSVLTTLGALGHATPALSAGLDLRGSWTSYGRDLSNSRSQPSPGGFDVDTVPRLSERWAIRRVGTVAGTTWSVTGSPAVVGGRVYYTDWSGRLTAVTLRSGRVIWSTKVSATPTSAAAAVNSSPTVSGRTVYVTAQEGRVVAVSADTGAVRWSTVLDRHGLTTVYSSPTVAGRRLVVGVASAENFFLPGPYDFRGSVAALDTRTGRILWQRYTMPRAGGRGGSVWGTAAIDRGRGLVYVGTGQAYSRPAGALTDALLALRLKNGSLVWHRQFTRGDVWNVLGGDIDGPDHDIGASPNLFTIGRQDVVGVGDKGGRYATFDRDTGATVWRRRLCAGSHLGGIMTTAAVARGSIWVACNKPSAAALETNTGDREALYFDWPLDKPPSRSDIYRLGAADGRTHWRRRVPAISLGALAEAGGVVLVPSTDGTLRAVNGRTGRPLWKAHLGAAIGGGPTIAEGNLLTGFGVQFGGAERGASPPAHARGGIVAFAPRR